MKEKDLIRGKWYKNELNKGQGDYVIFQFREYINGKIYAGIKQDTDEYFIDIFDDKAIIHSLAYQNSLYIGDVIDIQKISYEEVINCFPNNHPERINFRIKRIKFLLS